MKSQTSPIQEASNPASSSSSVSSSLPWSESELSGDELRLLDQLYDVAAISDDAGSRLHVGSSVRPQQLGLNARVSDVEANVQDLISNQTDGLESVQAVDVLERLLRRGYFSNGPEGTFEITDKLVQLYEDLEGKQDSTPSDRESFSIRVIDCESDFSNLRDAWDKLTTEPLRGFVWHRQWWSEFASDFKLRIHCLEQDGEVVGIAPLFETRWLGQKTLRFVGSGKVCTDYASLIVAPQHHQQFVDALRDEIALDGSIEMLELEGVDRRGPASDLKTALASSYWSYEKVIDACWFLELPETWEEFVKGSPKSLRRKIRKAEKRLAAGEVSIRSTAGDLEFDEAFEILVRLHQLRFEAKGEPGVFADPSFYAFLKSATKELCAVGKAEINVSFVDGQPMSAQHYLMGDAGPQFYQGGLTNERLDLEPGHLMFTYAVKKAIERGDREFDFLRGDEPYKAFWGATRRPLSTVRLVARKMKPTVIHTAFRKLRSAKHALKNVLKRLN